MEPVEANFDSLRGTAHTIHTYAWTPPTPPRGAVFLIHGFRSHTGFNFLSTVPPEHPDERARYSVYEGSFVQQLVDLGLIVLAHDHIGHGKSTGTRGYFESVDQLVEDTLDYVDRAVEERSLHSLPKFLVGHSLGGSITILCAKRRPKLFRGCVLSSAAVEPPPDMLGTKGAIMSRFSGVLSYLVPEVEVIGLPRNTRQPELQKLFDEDPLCVNMGVRARVGHEMVQMYKTLSEDRGSIDFPFLYGAGGADTLVNPEAGRRFCDEVQSADKEFISFPGIWHNVFTENGNEVVRAKYRDWIAARLD